MEFLRQYLNQENGLFSFSGRLSRAGFFIGMLLTIVFSSMLVLPMSYALIIFAPQLAIAAGHALPIFIGIIVALYVFLEVTLLVLNVAAMTRRFREAGVSFYNFFWLLLPFIGTAIVFCQLIRRPTEAHHE